MTDVKAFREERGWTQWQAALALGVTQQTISWCELNGASHTLRSRMALWRIKEEIEKPQVTPKPVIAALVEEGLS